MKGSDYWAEHAGQVRLVKFQRESELQGIKVEPWYFLYWSDEHQGLKDSNSLMLARHHGRWNAHHKGVEAAARSEVERLKGELASGGGSEATAALTG